MAKYEKRDGIVFRNDKPLINKKYKSFSEKGPVTSKLTKKAVKIRTYNALRTGRSVLSIIIGLLLLVGIVQIVNHPETSHFPTFTGLLEFFSNLEVVQVPFISNVSTELGDWGVFNWFRDFIASINGILNVLVFLVNGVIGLVQYIVNFMQFIFM